MWEHQEQMHHFRDQLEIHEHGVCKIVRYLWLLQEILRAKLYWCIHLFLELCLRNRVHAASKSRTTSCLWSDRRRVSAAATDRSRRNSTRSASLSCMRSLAAPLRQVCLSPNWLFVLTIKMSYSSFFLCRIWFRVRIRIEFTVNGRLESYSEYGSEFKFFETPENMFKCLKYLQITKK